jgi:hypothetical protein
VRQEPGEPGALWYDDEAGPMVRPYTVTGGRTHPDEPAVEADMVTVVRTEAGPDARGAATDRSMGPPGSVDGAPDGPSSPAAPDSGDVLDDPHLALLEHCRGRPLSVAELAARADLPLGVVRVLLSDLLRTGHVCVSSPLPSMQAPDEGLLRDVISRLKSL